MSSKSQLSQFLQSTPSTKGKSKYESFIQSPPTPPKPWYSNLFGMCCIADERVRYRNSQVETQPFEISPILDHNQKINQHYYTKHCGDSGRFYFIDPPQLDLTVQQFITNIIGKSFIQIPNIVYMCQITFQKPLNKLNHNPLYNYMSYVIKQSKHKHLLFDIHYETDLEQIITLCETSFVENATLLVQTQVLENSNQSTFFDPTIFGPKPSKRGLAQLRVMAEKVTFSPYLDVIFWGSGSKLRDLSLYEEIILIPLGLSVHRYLDKYSRRLNNTQIQYIIQQILPYLKKIDQVTLILPAEIHYEDIHKIVQLIITIHQNTNEDSSAIISYFNSIISQREILLLQEITFEFKNKMEAQNDLIEMMSDQLFFRFMDKVKNQYSYPEQQFIKSFFDGLDGFPLGLLIKDISQFKKNKIKKTDIKIFLDILSRSQFEIRQKFHQILMRIHDIQSMSPRQESLLPSISKNSINSPELQSSYRTHSKKLNKTKSLCSDILSDYEYQSQQMSGPYDQIFILSPDSDDGLQESNIKVNDVSLLELVIDEREQNKQYVQDRKQDSTLKNHVLIEKRNLRKVSS